MTLLEYRQNTPVEFIECLDRAVSYHTKQGILFAVTPEKRACVFWPSIGYDNLVPVDFERHPDVEYEDWLLFDQLTFLD